MYHHRVANIRQTNTILTMSSVKYIFYNIKGLVFYPIFILYYFLVPRKLLNLIAEDYHHWCIWMKRSYTHWGFVLLFCELKEFRSIVYKRLGWRHFLISWLWKRQSNLTLACNQIGPGIIVQHGYCTVVCASSIGKNFHVNQCVNIVWNGDKQCKIGDNVTVCAGAIIVGGITIGDNVIIGAGAVVVKDVPSNSIVVGNPMRIISKGK